ncbi:MAG: hypothetical protein JXA96_15165 [Sedimentisphaerales bacterium]|nr:hypothetical protein [Sedimentisphaerales bacterium]
MKKYSKNDQKVMAQWAVDCAERVLSFFEDIYPDDNRPRKALETCRTWIRTGVFKMADIRGTSLASHSAARNAKENPSACFAARAAGQAVATAHVPQHAYGGAYYALKVIAATDSYEAVKKEFDWQSEQLPIHLREGIMNRVIIQKSGNKITIKLQKDKNF